MTKRKLKGINSKKIPKNKKKKMERTLAKMDEVREKDITLLREEINAKLKFSIAEREKGLKVIQEYKNKIKIIEKQLLKLEGAIIVLSNMKGISKIKKDVENDTNNN